MFYVCVHTSCVSVSEVSNARTLLGANCDYTARLLDEANLRLEPDLLQDLDGDHESVWGQTNEETGGVNKAAKKKGSVTSRGNNLLCASGQDKFQHG